MSANARPIEPGPGQESVWDYPRPPRLEASDRCIAVTFNGEEIVRSSKTIRVLETSHPPAYYIPPDDVRMDCFEPTARRSFCEWKGVASYYTIAVGDRAVRDAAWTYLQPVPDFAAIAGYVALYPSLMDACWVDGEQVQPQPGNVYGGWITRAIVGPFKGAPGTWGW